MTDKNQLTLVCSLRLIVPSLNDVEEFKEHFPQYSESHRKYFKDKSKYVITVNLEELVDLKPLKKLLDDRRGHLTHDFFISVSTGNDSEIVEIPDFVIECIRNFGGKVNFSFTCVG